jgi:hypothetical protein
MLTLHFDHPVSHQARRVGPAPYFRLRGDSLRAGPNDVVLGTHHRGVWTLDGECFLTITTEAPALLRFEEGGAPCAHPYGPYDQVKIVDGAIRHGAGFSELLAKLDEVAGVWFVYAEQKNCAEVLLTAG